MGSLQHPEFGAGSVRQRLEPVVVPACQPGFCTAATVIPRMSAIGAKRTLAAVGRGIAAWQRVGMAASDPKRTLVPSLNPPYPQPERVGDDGHGAERHGGGGKDR